MTRRTSDQRVASSARTVGRVGAVRVAGLVLLAATVLFGIRLLGSAEFGRAVIVQSAAILIALPITALEHLAVRTAAREETVGVAAIWRRATRFSMVVLIVGSGAGAVALLFEPAWATAAWSISITAATLGPLLVGQGLKRGLGDFSWGQVPNEVLRPAATIGAFLAVAIGPDFAWRGGVAVAAAASVATLPVIANVGGTLRRSTAGSGPMPQADGLRTARATRAFLLFAVATTVNLQLYPVLVGATTTTSDVTAVAVAARLLQLGAFGLTLGNFVFSPDLATKAASIATQPEAWRVVRKVHVLGLVIGAPVVAVCTLGAGLVARVFDISDVAEAEHVIALAGIVVAILLLSGPIFNALLMAGQEVRVAAVFAAAVLIGLAIYFARGDLDASGAIIAQGVAFALANLVLHLDARRTYGQFVL